MMINHWDTVIMVQFRDLQYTAKLERLLKHMQTQMVLPS